MGDWYGALKKPGNPLRRNHQNPQNPPGYSFDCFEGSPSEQTEKFAGGVEGGFEGFEGASPVRGENFSSAPTLPSAPWPGCGTKESQASSKIQPCTSGRDRQNPQNRTKVGFEGFVGSPVERIANFSPSSGWDAEDWQAAFDERAAILEYDAGQPRTEAERIARVEVFKMGGGAP